jgi:hypothetical protein
MSDGKNGFAVHCMERALLDVGVELGIERPRGFIV